MLKLEVAKSCPRVSHPGRILPSQPNRCNLKHRNRIKSV